LGLKLIKKIATRKEYTDRLKGPRLAKNPRGTSRMKKGIRSAWRGGKIVKRMTLGGDTKRLKFRSR